MAEVALGEMKFDHESLQHMLMLLDRMIGKQNKDFEVVVNQGQGYLKLRTHCRHCKMIIRSEESYNRTGWSDRLINNLVMESDRHQSMRHKSLILTGNAIGNAIHCDICKLEAGTDATECFDDNNRSMWVCHKCAEDAERYAKSTRVAT